LLQAEAAKNGADRAYKKELEKLAKYKKQLEKCEIFAPHEGMATYAIERDRKTHVGEGRTVRERQRIITLPDLSSMEVKIGVHESVLDSIQVGLPATIAVDAFPNRKFKGSIKSVAVLADPGEWHSTDVKVYTTIVTIDEEVTDLRPGMSSVVEIHIERVRNVLTVPVQAIVQVGEDNWVYVGNSAGGEKRPVTVGKTNEKFIEIREGIKAGERVVLNPMALVQAEGGDANEIDPEKDLDESIEYGLDDASKTSEKKPGKKKPRKKPSKKPTKKPAPAASPAGKPAAKDK